MDFNKGFNDGYQKILRERLKVGITPVAMRPIGSDGSYESGFAAGSAQAAADIASGKIR